MATREISVKSAAAEEIQVNPWLIAVVVSLAAFMEVLDTSIANVALPHIAGDLGASTDESTWVLTSAGGQQGCGSLSGAAIPKWPFSQKRQGRGSATSLLENFGTVCPK